MAYIVLLKAEDGIRVTDEAGFQACALTISATTACTTPPTAGAVNFCVTTGNNLGTIGLAAGNGGWGVTITNNNLTTPLVKCAIFINTAGLEAPTSELPPPPQKTCRLLLETKKRRGLPPPPLFLPSSSPPLSPPG